LVAIGAAKLGSTNDAIAVLQHLVTGRFTDAAIEGAGVVGQAGGASLGIAAVDLAIGTSKVIPATRVAGYLVSSTVGAYIGSAGSKEMAVEVINSLDTTAPLAPGQTVQPVATLNGTTYGLGLTVDGRLDWYAVTSNSNLALPSETISLPLALRQELTDQLAKTTLPEVDFTKYSHMVNELETLGDISEHIVPRIEPIGTVAIDESLNTPPTAAQVQQKVADGFSPVGWEPLNQAITDNFGNSHTWHPLPDGSVERVEQRGGSITVTTYPKGSATPSFERQTVRGDDGIVSDILLKPDASGQMAVVKTQLGGLLDASDIPTPTPTSFTPLPSSGTADNSYTIKPGDSLWKIGKTLGLSDSETAQFVAETQANARAAGSDGNADDLKPGNTVAIPDWAKDKLAAYKEASINGLDLPPSNSPASDGADGSDAPSPAPDSSTDEIDAAYEQIIDAFSNIDTSQVGPGVQYADAGNGGVVSDAGGGSSSAGGDSASCLPPDSAGNAQTTPETVANPNSYTAYLSGAGASLSPAQQDALATQLDTLGLGGADGAGALSFYPLPGGGVLIGNADGDIVGELRVSSTGEVRLQANTVNADGSAGTQDLHISTSGASTAHAEVVAAQQAALAQAHFNAAANDAAGVLSLVNTLANLEHFDQLTDLGKVQSLVSLYNQIDNLGSATAQLTGTGSGGNLPGDLGQWGAGLGLITALQGNDPIAQASAAGAFYNTFASSSNAIPLPYLQALNLIGAIESGNTVSMIASAVAFIPGWGTALSIAITILAPLFADKPPPPEGVTHFEWDANGDIQIRMDFNQSHGGEMAQRTATSVQGLLNSIVQSINDQTPDTSDDVAINPYPPWIWC
jgi:hypothetical protein